MDRLDSFERRLKNLEKRVKKLEKFFPRSTRLYFEVGDELLDQAINVVKQHDKVSPSLLQRRLSIGYARAARIIDILEKKRIVSRDMDTESRRVLKNVKM